MDPVLGRFCTANVPYSMVFRCTSSSKVLLCVGCRFSDFEQDVWSLYNLEFGDQMGKATGWQSLDEVYRVSGPTCWGCGILSKLCSKCRDPCLHTLNVCILRQRLHLSQTCAQDHCLRLEAMHDRQAAYANQGWMQMARHVLDAPGCHLVKLLKGFSFLVHVLD